MAGRSDGNGGGGSWLAEVFEQLRLKVDEALEAVKEIPAPKSLTEIAAVGRTVTVIARAAKAVDVLRPRIKAGDEEDEMGGRTYDPEEDERLRRQLAAHCDRLDKIIEIKRDREGEGGGASTGAAQGAGECAPTGAD